MALGGEEAQAIEVGELLVAAVPKRLEMVVNIWLWAVGKEGELLQAIEVGELLAAAAAEWLWAVGKEGELSKMSSCPGLPKASAAAPASTLELRDYIVISTVNESPLTPCSPQAEPLVLSTSASPASPNNDLIIKDQSTET